MTGVQGVTGIQGITGIGFPVDSINGLIEFPVNKTYVLSVYAVAAATIDNISIKTSAGTCTAAVTITGVNVGSLSGLSVTSTIQTVSATAPNTVNVGDTINLVLTSVVTVSDLQFSIKFTRS
jgi:hypothetical protein